MMTPYVVTRYYRAPEVIVTTKYRENGVCIYCRNIFFVVGKGEGWGVLGLEKRETAD